ncbi:MAG: glutamate 5-kinase [Oscillospiraceae bacterium]|jgi:glutamate 5-kinase|nr:glutamate 5-kinase [Oscillospiraceae bacterium]
MNAYRRVVVKVGTSTLTHETGALNLGRIERLARVLSDAKNEGRELVLVTSGAIGVGVSKLGLTARPDALPQKQAAAAIGQCRLMRLYDQLFGEYGHTVGQILLTRADVRSPERRGNLETTFDALLNWGVLPIVNENDSVSSDEIEHGQQRLFGDNDTLSAVVAELVRADLLILLTDIDALYDADPREHPHANPIPIVRSVDDVLLSRAGGAGTARGTGGMQTKLLAGQIALTAGIDMVVASGENPEIVRRILNGEQVGTLFQKEDRGQKIENREKT